MMIIQALHHDRGRMLVSRDITPLQRPRRVNWCVRAVGASENMDADHPDVPLFANLHDDDPAVLAAVSEFKRTLPRFLAAASSVRFSPATYLVKVPFIDRSGTGEQALVYTRDTATENSGRPICHLWLSVTNPWEGVRPILSRPAQSLTRASRPPPALSGRGGPPHGTGGKHRGGPRKPRTGTGHPPEGRKGIDKQ